MPKVWNLSACALAFCALAAPAALADPPDVAATISGTLERTHVDTATGPRAITVLSTASGPQVVTFSAAQPVPPNGAEVDLRGRLKGTTLEASSATITGPTVAVPTTAPGSTALADQQGTPLASGTPRTVAIVVITFSSTVAPSYTDAQLQNVLVSNPNSVSNYFSEQSYGAVSFRGIVNAAGDVFHASIAASGSGCSSNAWQTWGSQAKAIVGASTLNQYDHVIYVFNSQGTCAWAGLAYMPGSEVYIDNAFVLSVVSHELGHNLGVHHAAALRCTSGGQNVAFSSAAYACTPSEYGDPYDIMGSSSTNQQNAFHKLQSGWLGASSGPRVQTITASGDYTVGPLESSSGVALLLVPHVTTGAIVATNPATVLGDTFALDFRQPTGAGTYFDAYAPSSAAIGGVQIRLVQTPGGAANQTQLIDANPLTATFADAALTPGATFTDATDAITITTTDVNPLGATVHVTIGTPSGGGTTAPLDTTPPSSVSSLTATVESGPVVTLAFGAATDDHAVASYRVTRDGAQIDNLAADSTTYDDWTAPYGAHTYGVAAVDSAGNVGPIATVATVIAVPVPPSSPPSTKPGIPKPSTTKPATKAKTVKVTVRIVGASAGDRRALLSWTRVAGARGYVVSRNGRRLRATKARTLVDTTPPRGKLLYVVTVSR